MGVFLGVPGDRRTNLEIVTFTLFHFSILGGGDRLNLLLCASCCFSIDIYFFIRGSSLLLNLLFLLQINWIMSFSSEFSLAGSLNMWLFFLNIAWWSKQGAILCIEALLLDILRPFLVILIVRSNQFLFPYIIITFDLNYLSPIAWVFFLPYHFFPPVLLMPNLIVIKLTDIFSTLNVVTTSISFCSVNATGLIVDLWSLNHILALTHLIFACLTMIIACVLNVWMVVILAVTYTA